MAWKHIWYRSIEELLHLFEASIAKESSNWTHWNNRCCKNFSLNCRFSDVFRLQSASQSINLIPIHILTQASMSTVTMDVCFRICCQRIGIVLETTIISGLHNKKRPKAFSFCFLETWSCDSLMNASQPESNSVVSRSAGAIESLSQAHVANMRSILTGERNNTVSNERPIQRGRVRSVPGVCVKFFKVNF